jgi:hypothetical protein
MSQQTDILMPEIVQGMKAAGLDAIKQARAKGTKLVVLKDDKIVEVTPDEAEAMLRMDEENNKS